MRGACRGRGPLATVGRSTLFGDVRRRGRAGLVVTVAMALVAFATYAHGVESPTATPDESAVLLTRAETFLATHAKIVAGESVLLITDTSVDVTVRQAFVKAAAKAGGVVSELVLQGYPEVTDGLEIARKMRFVRWFPEWIWMAAAQNRVVLDLSSLSSGHIGGRADLPPATRFVDVPFAHREQLADPMARGNYPEEILEAIARTLWKQVAGGHRFELRDPEGTELRWTLDKGAWQEVKNADPARNAEHISMPPPYRSKVIDMQGWLVGSSTHSGPLPRIRLKVEQGRVVAVEDGKHVADYLRRMFDASRNVAFAGFPGSGSNWIEEVAIGTHPRHRRVPGAETLGWSAGMASWNGAPRAGVVHLAVGTSRSGRNFALAQQHGLEVQHLDVEIYRPTLTVDGRTIITDGQLTALDDPEVRRVAARFGDPDDLLRVTWFPKGR